MDYIFEPLTKAQTISFLNCRRKNNILIGHEFFTCGDSLKLSTEDINELLNLKKINKISLKINRLFHEEEIDDLILNLKKINLDKVKYIFYSDLGLIDVFNELNLSDKLVYDAYTYTTNCLDIIEYAKFNKYVIVSNQISIDELKELLDKLNNKVIIYGFGKSVVFYSKRPLLTNYFKYRNLEFDPNDSNYSLKEEFREDFYHIFEDEHGTYVYEPKHYYLFDELNELKNVEHIIINSATLSTTSYKKVVDAYLDNNLDKLLNANILLYKGIMETKSVLLKSEVTCNE